MDITLCDKNQKGDVPVYSFDEWEKAIDFIYDWLRTKDFKESVFVCFPSWINLPKGNFRDEQNDILVSHSRSGITDMVEYYLDSDQYEEMYFSIFEFNSYFEAFNYCIDLRESF